MFCGDKLVFHESKSVFCENKSDFQGNKLVFCSHIISILWPQYPICHVWGSVNYWGKFHLFPSVCVCCTRRAQPPWERGEWIRGVWVCCSLSVNVSYCIKNVKLMMNCKRVILLHLNRQKQDRPQTPLKPLKGLCTVCTCRHSVKCLFHFIFTDLKTWLVLYRFFMHLKILFLFVHHILKWMQNYLI